MAWNTTSMPTGSGGNSAASLSNPANPGWSPSSAPWGQFTQTAATVPMWAKFGNVTPGSWESIMSRPDMQRRSTRTRADVMTSAQSAADQYRRNQGNNAGSDAQESLLGLLGGAQATRAADDMFQSERGFLTDVGFKNAGNDLQAQLANLSASLANNQNTISQDAQRLANIQDMRANALGNRNAGINEALGMGRLDLDRTNSANQNEFNWANMMNQLGLDYAGLNQNQNQFNQGQQMDWIQSLTGQMGQAGYNPLMALGPILQALGGMNIPGYQVPDNLGELLGSLGMSNNTANVDSANAANANNQQQQMMDMLMSLFGQFTSGSGGGSGGGSGSGGSGSGGGNGGYSPTTNNNNWWNSMFGGNR